jgi:hypothetical protein
LGQALIPPKTDRRETFNEEIVMGKRTQIKGQKKPEPSAREKHERIPVRSSSSSLQRAAAPLEANLPHSPAAGGASPPNERIAVRAYQLWEAQGKPVGTDRENWFEAERLLRAETR